MEELKITEDPENQIFFIATPKRKEKIKVYVPLDGRAQWRICYESGKKVPELQGAYLTSKEAIKAVRIWLNKERQSQTAKQYDLFGDKEPPVLKRKKVSARETRTDNS